MGATATAGVARDRGSRFATARLGWIVFAATSAALLAAVALDLRAASFGSLLYLAVAGVLALIGVLLTTRRPDHRIAWVLAVTAGWWVVGGLMHAYAVEALVEAPGSVPGGLAVAWADNWWWLPGLVVPLGLMLTLMPDGHLASNPWWPVLGVVALGTTLASFAVSVAPTLELDPDATIENPLALDTPVVEALGLIGVGLIVAGLVASGVAFVVRFRRSRDEERQQLRWVGVSLAFAVPLFLVGAALWGVVPGAQVLPALALLALPTGIAIAILRYRLYEIDLFVNRTLVYGAMTIGVVVAYVAVVGLVGAVLTPRGDLVVSLVVTGIVAVGFQPVCAIVQRFVNRLMYGERDDPYTALAGLGKTLTSSLQLDAVLPRTVETLGETLALHYVGIAISGELVAEYGSPGSESLDVPLVHQGARVGDLLIAARSGERFRERDRRLVADIAPQVAAAVHAVELSRDLRLARERIVQLREEERRRIRRDLHDGLGPALAGLTFTLEAVRNLAATDLRRADELLVSATEQVQTMIADVRQLIYGLRPPALDQLGLVASLRGLAEKEPSSQTSFSVVAPISIPALSAAVEVAVYWIVQEALTNVRRHAGATRCELRVMIEPRSLRLEIEDDGRGLRAESPGIGLHTMRERAAEVGGTCEIGAGPRGGTLVRADLPRLSVEAAV